MKVTLLTNKYAESGNATSHILFNRGLPREELYHYINSSDKDINDPMLFGEDSLNLAAKTLIKHISLQDNILVIVDADCDGFTSSAVLINYLYDLFPSFVENHLHYFFHEGKQHGLADCMAEASKYKLILLPDAGSNDYSFHKELKDAGSDIIILDHHIAEKISKDAIIINNQLSAYPNKELSGVGVVWQFCRYLDSISNNTYAEEYLDLVALGLMADMQSMLSLETKHLIFKGFQSENVKNPFIFQMAQKNSFSLNKPDYKPSRYNHLQFTPMGSAFFIAPFVNALVRSGNQEEKKIVFESMLKFKAFTILPSTKRGHKLGETERLIDQALRVCTNVKNRQTKAQDAGVELLEGLIEENHMLDHKVLLFLLEAGEMEPGVVGLIANKLMFKYQRPCLILIKIVEEETGEIFYRGSGRGYGKEMDFRKICEDSGAEYSLGHPGAFGCSIAAEEIENFVKRTDEVLKNLSSEPSYFVDYIWAVDQIDGDKILEIADMNDYWGKDIDRALVFIKGIKVNQDNFKVMKSNTLKYTLPTVDIIQFSGTEEEIDKFNTPNIIEINAVCKCCSNEWNYQINPQLQMIDYEIIDIEEPTLIQSWNF